MPWSRTIHILMEGAMVRSEKMNVLDFFRHLDPKRSPLATSQISGIVLLYTDFMRAIETGKRQKRKKCVGTQVSEANFPASENFDDLFND